MGVAETTVALLTHMSTPMKRGRKRKLLTEVPHMQGTKKKGRKKTQNKDTAAAAEEAAPAPMAPKAKAKKPPTIKYKKMDNRFLCFYNNLPGKSFYFKKKAEMIGAKMHAEDISAMSPSHSHL